MYDVANKVFRSRYLLPMYFHYGTYETMQPRSFRDSFVINECLLIFSFYCCIFTK